MNKKEVKSKSRNLFGKNITPIRSLPTYVMPDVEKAQETFVKELNAPGGGGVEIFQSPPAQTLDERIAKVKSLKKRSKQELVDIVADDKLFRYDKKLKSAVKDTTKEFLTTNAFTTLVHDVVLSEAATAYHDMHKKMAEESDEVSYLNRKCAEQAMELHRLQERIVAMEKSNQQSQPSSHQPPAESHRPPAEQPIDLEQDRVQLSESYDELVDYGPIDDFLLEPTPQGEQLEDNSTSDNLITDNLMSSSLAKRVSTFEATNNLTANRANALEATSLARGPMDYPNPPVPPEYPVPQRTMDFPATSPSVIVTTQSEIPFIMDTINYANVSKLWKYVQHTVLPHQKRPRAQYFSTNAFMSVDIRFEVAGEANHNLLTDEEFFNKLLRMLTTGHTLKSVSLKDMLIAQKYVMSPNVSIGLEVFNAFHKVEQFKDEVKTLTKEERKDIVRHVQAELWKGTETTPILKLFLRKLDDESRSNETYDLNIFAKQVCKVWVDFMKDYQLAHAETTRDESRKYSVAKATSNSNSTSGAKGGKTDKSKGKSSSSTSKSDKKRPAGDSTGNNNRSSDNPVCKVCGRQH